MSGESFTTVKGYLNMNNQVNMGATGKAGTHPNQKAYDMKCRVCDKKYVTNGCDIWNKKCPHCQRGKA